jgi:hypothetical protein
MVENQTNRERVIRTIKNTLRNLEKLKDSDKEENLTKNVDSISRKIESKISGLDSRLSVAFIGGQKTGKSSIINSLLSDVNLPVGENGLDRFVTRVVHKSFSSDWGCDTDSGAVLQMIDGSQTNLNKNELTTYFSDLKKNSHQSQQFLNVKELIVFSEDHLLLSMNILNTPGLFYSEPKIIKLILEVTRESSVVFWVFAANDFEALTIESDISKTLRNRVRPAIGVLNKLEDLTNLEAMNEAQREEKRLEIERLLLRVKETYGSYLDESVVPYSSWSVSDQTESLAGQIFKNSLNLREAIEDCKVYNEDEEKRYKMVLSQVEELLLELRSALQQESDSIHSSIPPKLVSAATLNSKLIIPYVASRKESLNNFCISYTLRIAELQAPIFKEVLDNYLSIWQMGKHGVWGLFNEDKKLHSVIQAQIQNRCESIAEDITRIQNSLISEFASKIEDFTQEIKGLLIDEIGSFKFSSNDFKEEGSKLKGRPIYEASDFIPRNNILEELSKSLLNALVAIGQKVAKEMLEAVSKKLSEAILEKVSEKVAQKTAEKVVASVGKVAAEKATTAVLKDIISFWMIVTLPADILALLKDIDTSKKQAKVAVEERLFAGAEASAARYEDFFKDTLNDYKRTIFQTVETALESQEDSRNQDLKRMKQLSAVSECLNDCLENLKK